MCVCAPLVSIDFFDFFDFVVFGAVLVLVLVAGVVGDFAAVRRSWYFQLLKMIWDHEIKQT